MVVRRAAAIAATLFAAALSGVLICSAAAQDVPRLPPLAIDRSGISVSGISSGAYMAHQFHVAHSRDIMGAAMLAGGPYYCAGGGYPFNIFQALAVCSDFVILLPFLGPPDVASVNEEIEQQARRQAIDDPSHLAEDRVYLFSGNLDEQVPQAVVTSLNHVYDVYIKPENILHVDSVPAAHAMVTEDFGAACDEVAPPYINDCDYDAAGELLRHIYGALDNPIEPTGSIFTFDQSEFFPASEETGMNPRGQVYIPEACAAGATCRLHVAFHGCSQYQENIGDAFYANAGYNRWAEANDIVVLYPQTRAFEHSFMGIPLAWPNPRGCWDWWGYTGSEYHVKTGPQIRAIAAMIDRLAGQR
jgi:hypothetical protein